MSRPSPFFARIKADVLAIMAAVPPGRLVTFGDIGAHLDVVPRHVAYILAMLQPEEAEALAWYRAVPAEGRLALRPKAGAAGSQARAAERLRAEGHRIDSDGQIAEFATRLVAVADLAHGVPKQTRLAVTRTRRGAA